MPPATIERVLGVSASALRLASVATEMALGNLSQPDRPRLDDERGLLGASVMNETRRPLRRNVLALSCELLGKALSGAPDRRSFPGLAEGASVFAALGVAHVFDDAPAEASPSRSGANRPSNEVPPRMEHRRDGRSKFAGGAVDARVIWLAACATALAVVAALVAQLRTDQVKCEPRSTDVSRSSSVAATNGGLVDRWWWGARGVMALRLRGTGSPGGVLPGRIPTLGVIAETASRR